MAESEQSGAGIEARLAELQERIQAQMEARREAQEPRAIAEIDETLAALREARQRLWDERLALQQSKRSREWQSQAAPRRRKATANSASPRRKALLAMATFGGIALLMSALLIWVAQRVLVAPSIEEALAAGDSEFTWHEGMGLEERIKAVQLSLNEEKIFTPISDDPTEISFEILPGMAGGTVADELEEEGLISDAALFVTLMEFRGVDQSLEAGVFTLRRNMSMDEVLSALQRAERRDEVTITVLEGWRAEEVAAMLEAEGLVSAEEYMTLVNNPALFPEYPFLADLPAGATLEGYLFPDTYRIFGDEASADSIIRLQLSTFNRRVPPELRQAAVARGMSLFQAVTLASIVEREAVVPVERETIAGVYINRWQDGTVLNADPTIQYALGYQPTEETWWKRPLSLDDLAVDSPYNSYTVAGLPPGPIANPGLDALRATIEAPPTDYYYFVSRNDGTHAFAVTLEEHNANVAQFQSAESAPE
ncbi:MAG: endolytic transglycosylase MltG [Anaerolineales bacterium]|nr:endolytic transglycosylase MltG [Anaerolineales bacterium]MCB9128885.1 endolytic transglycosylase MltG [Ardenticatenales bacterium]MCB9172867.1 endolytic transglycosylase MltG [Ardenticatenales bacterium]